MAWGAGFRCGGGCGGGGGGRRALRAARRQWRRRHLPAGATQCADLLHADLLHADLLDGGGRPATLGHPGCCEHGLVERAAVMPRLDPRSLIHRTAAPNAGDWLLNLPLIGMVCLFSGTPSRPTARYCRPVGPRIRRRRAASDTTMRRTLGEEGTWKRCQRTA